MSVFLYHRKKSINWVERMEIKEFGPSWLMPMLRADYFATCRFHGDSNKSECNLFCLDCCGNAICPYCLIHHKNHHTVQIRRSSYNNVVRVNEIQRYLDISCVQTYIINSAKIVFLNERPQARPGKGVTHHCEICGRSLVDAFRFCSIGCKLGGLNRGDSKLSFTLKMNHMIHGYEFHGELLRGSVSSGEEEGTNNMSPGTPPIFNNRNSSRRKGVPHRAPF
ncbi:unnamed protein product [Lactuca virosa]|uniref:PLATZ transcription factor family protein n=1 Tax=Lactuca virosa TaxID=75947 RepID=A0AAU9N5L5_9ASTR|nr:unnamed protein product [Lactuca virosa]